MKKLFANITTKGRFDQFEIWNHLADTASIEVADRVIRDILDAIDHISSVSGAGHFRRDLTRRNIRFYLVHSYFIVYRTTRNELIVLRLLHASRDIAGELKRL